MARKIKKKIDDTLFNTQVRIKGKWSNSEKGVALSLTPRCSSY